MLVFNFPISIALVPFAFDRIINFSLLDLDSITMAQKKYSEKFNAQIEQTLYGLLSSEEQRFIKTVAERYRMTLQQLRIITQAARDLSMWREKNLESWWNANEEKIAIEDKRARSRELFIQLEKYILELSQADKIYPKDALAGPPRRHVKFSVEEQFDKKGNPRQIYGLCPAYSEQTVCCGLYTLDAVTGCPFDCSYCTIQTFYGEEAVLDQDLPTKLASLNLEKDKFVHIGTGQSSDALVWGNAGGMLDALCRFAEENPQILLELKTKSDRVDYFLERDIPKNVICSWTLGTDPIIANEEHGTAHLEKRIQAARALCDKGMKVAFHCHPMVRYQGWQDGYHALAEDLLKRFSAEDILFFTMGTVTLIRPVVSEIRKRGGESKILQMELVADHHGKLTYPDASKIELYHLLYHALKPWHDDVFFYLCMENKEVWQESIGFYHETNQLFEQAFGEHFRRCI